MTRLIIRRNTRISFRMPLNRRGALAGRGGGYGDALAEMINGLYTNVKLIHRPTSWKTHEFRALATLDGGESVAPPSSADGTTWRYPAPQMQNQTAIDNSVMPPPRPALN
ncbi:hypothetical protein [Burkholderia singularis]